MTWFRLRSPAVLARHAHRFVPGWTIGTFRVPVQEQHEHPYRAAVPPASARGLVLVRSWAYPYVGLVFAFVFAAYLAFFSLALAFTNARFTINHHAASAAERSGAIVGSGLLALGCAYVAIVQLVNTTTLTVEPGGMLVFKHGPLPSLRQGLRAPSNFVTELRVVLRRHRKGRSYEVVAALNDGKRRALASFATEAHATRLARIVAVRLGHRLPAGRSAAAA